MALLMRFMATGLMLVALSADQWTAHRRAQRRTAAQVGTAGDVDDGSVPAGEAEAREAPRSPEACPMRTR